MPSPNTTATTAAALAAAARPDRNRAVDAYRAVAMLAVALGHWFAVSVREGADGELDAGNALAEAPGLAWITWGFQVMPLFFVVGGFSSAMSLDAHHRSGGRDADWVAARLRRMVAPAVALAATWLGLVAIGGAVGAGGLMVAGAAAAAIPLWFLANYTIDTAIAPTVLPAFRRRPAFVVGAGSAVFVGLEGLRMSGVPWVPHLNWVLGWLLFQVAGFAWRDGLLPTGRRLAGVALGLWGTALALVTVGPYPVAMVHHDGLTNSPTHPPSLALMVFGAAYAATAVLVAGWVSARLAVAPKAWTAVVAANAISLSVYLWHMTAVVVVIAAGYGLGVLPTATVASAAWWLQKVPLVLAATAVLAVIVAAVGRVERDALLAPRAPWAGGSAALMGTAGAISVAVKVWTLGNAPAVVAGTALLLVVWRTQLRVGSREVASVPTG